MRKIDAKFFDDMRRNSDDIREKELLDLLIEQKRKGKVFGKGERRVIFTCPLGEYEDTPDGIANALNEARKIDPEQRYAEMEFVFAMMEIGLIEADDGQIYVMTPALPADR